MSVADFVAANRPYADAASRRTGLPSDYILAQAGHESAWGSSNLARNSNNFFGMKNPGGNGYQQFGSPADSFDAYAGLINRRYAGAAGVAQSGGGGQEIASYLQSSGYAEDPAYGSKVGNAMALVAAAGGGGGAASYGLPPAMDQLFGPDGSFQGIPPVTQTLGKQAAGAASWLEEVITRTVMVLIGLVLIAGAFYMAGTGALANTLDKATSGNPIDRATRHFLP